MPTDATLEFLDRLKDESKWSIDRGVPVFAPHKRAVRDKDGKLIRTIEVTANDLSLIVENVHRLRREDGVVPRITIGHTDPKKPETEQPPVCGYEVNYRLGTFGDQQKPCILCDHYYYPDQADEARRHPHRSAEYYHDRRLIRGVALCTQDPWLELGMVAYQSADGPCYRYSVTADQPDDDGLQGEELDRAEKYMCHYQKKHPWVGHAMQQYSTFASDTNMATPATPTTPAAPTMPKPEGVDALEQYRMQNDQLRIDYQRLQGDIQSLRDELGNERKGRDKSECERMIVQLEAEYYQLDRATEVAVLVSVPTDKRGERLDYIRKHYKQHHPLTAPVPYAQGGTVPVIEGGDAVASEDGELLVTNAEQQQKCLRYMRDKGCTWDAAKEAVIGGKE